MNCKACQREKSKKENPDAEFMLNAIVHTCDLNKINFDKCFGTIGVLLNDGFIKFTNCPNCNGTKISSTFTSTGELVVCEECDFCGDDL